MCESMVPNQHAGVPKVPYKSDVGMSSDEIVLGFMEIAVLPDEPHKYYRKHA